MKLREHRGGLAESIEMTIEIDATMPALLAAVQAVMSRWGVDLTPDMLHVEPYSFDARIGWDTHIVTIDGHGVYGFTDGPLREQPNAEVMGCATTDKETKNG